MSSIVIESGSNGTSGIPALTEVKKGGFEAPKLTKVGEPTITVESVSNGPINDSRGIPTTIPPLTKVEPVKPEIPPLNKVEKTEPVKPEIPPLTKVEPAKPEVPPLTKVGETGPAKPEVPPLTKVGETDPVKFEAPPLTMVKTSLPAKIPPLQVAVKEEFTGLIFELNDDEKLILHKVFYGNEVQNMVAASDKVQEIFTSICKARFEKEVRRKIGIYKSGAGDGYPRTFMSFRILSYSGDSIKSKKILGTLNIQVLQREMVPKLHPFSQTADTENRFLNGIISSSLFVIVIVQNGDTAELEITPKLSSLFECLPMTFSSNIKSEVIAEMRSIEAKIISEENIQGMISTLSVP